MPNNIPKVDKQLLKNIKFQKTYFFDGLKMTSDDTQTYPQHGQTILKKKLSVNWANDYLTPPSVDTAASRGDWRWGTWSGTQPGTHRPLDLESRLSSFVGISSSPRTLCGSSSSWGRISSSSRGGKHNPRERRRQRRCIPVSVLSRIVKFEWRLNTKYCLRYIWFWEGDQIVNYWHSLNTFRELKSKWLWKSNATIQSLLIFTIWRFE